MVFQNVYKGFRRPKRYMNSYIETKYTLRFNCPCFRLQINQEQFLRSSQLPRKRTLWLGGVGPFRNVRYFKIGRVTYQHNGVCIIVILPQHLRHHCYPCSQGAPKSSLNNLVVLVDDISSSL